MGGRSRADWFGVPEGVVGNKECIPNVQGQVFKTDQAAYLAGYLAAGMTKTGKLGYFGGAKIPTVTIFGVGFQQGVYFVSVVVIIGQLSPLPGTLSLRRRWFLASCLPPV